VLSPSGLAASSPGHGDARSRKRLPPDLGDSEPGHLDLAVAGTNALGLRAHKALADQAGKQSPAKAMREHRPEGHAVRASGEQFEDAATVGRRTGWCANGYQNLSPFVVDTSVMPSGEQRRDGDRSCGSPVYHDP
jgi:hypothetical protein